MFLASELREDNCPPPTYLVEGVKALISALRTWLKREVSEPPVADARLHSSPPASVRPSGLSSSRLNTGALGSLQVSEPTSEVPDHIRPNHLIKELTKEIRHLEVRRLEEQILIKA